MILLNLSMKLKFKFSTIKTEKYPILITCCFFIITVYVAFYYHLYWTFDFDGIPYLKAGEEILLGNGKNVGLPDASVGGPIIYATLNLFFNDGFSVMKAISIFSGTGLVFFSYYIIRNIFNSKIALLTQIFFAFNPWCGLLSIQALNELFPIFITSVALYYVTKKDLQSSDVIISSLLVGIAFMIRFQVIIVFITFIIFFAVMKKKFTIKFYYIALSITFFCIATSPILWYNYLTHGNIFDNDSNFTLGQSSKYSNDEWRDKLHEGIGKGTLYGIFLDFDLFLKNYLYNLFYVQPDSFFGFDNRVSSSLIPAIPYIGMIPLLVGAVYSFKEKFNRYDLVILSSSTLVISFITFLFLEPSIHFFAIIIIPLISLGIFNVKNIKQNYLPLLILPVVFSFTLSVIPLRAPQHFTLVWISIYLLAAIFFVDVIPKMYLKMKQILSKNKLQSQSTQHVNIAIIFFVILILISNIVYSYVTIIVKSEMVTLTSINENFWNILKTSNVDKAGLDVKAVGEFLSKQPNIEKSYVMTDTIQYPYYAGSKWILVSFLEGPQTDPIDHYITRKNWKKWEVYVSNTHSNPMDRYGIYDPRPDYLVVVPYHYSERFPVSQHYLDLLLDPQNPEIPDNFVPIFKSEKGTIIYKIYYK